MKPDLSQAEVEALLGEEVRSNDVVAARDFSRPMRIGPAQLDDLKKRVNSCLPAIERAMTPRFRGDLALTLSHIGETTRSSFLDTLEERDFFVQSFTLNGQAGWVYWAPNDARQAIEKSLGCGSSAALDAPLSHLERALAGGFTTEIAARLSSQLGATLSELLERSGDQPIPASLCKVWTLSLMVGSAVLLLEVCLFEPNRIEVSLY